MEEPRKLAVHPELRQAADVRWRNSHPPKVILKLLIPTFALGGCAFPELPLTTPEPLKFEFTVDLNVRRYEGDKPGEDEDLTTESAETEVLGENLTEVIEQAEARREKRSGQIQVIKNNRIVGESRDGTLEIRTTPPGEYGNYVQRTVAAENKDRQIIAQALAKAEEKPLEEIQRQQAEIFRNKSFQGEWIEVPEVTGSGFTWIQKESDPEQDDPDPSMDELINPVILEEESSD